MRLAITAFALSTSIAVAGGSPSDCPPPKPLSCARLLELVDQRNCASKIVCPPSIVECNPQKCGWDCASCPQPECPTCAECAPCPPPEVVTEVPRGNWMAGGGPVHVNKLGLSAVVGYRFPRGVTLIGGPVYTPNGGDIDPRTCKIGCRTCTVPGERAGREWGAQFLALVPIGR